MSARWIVPAALAAACATSMAQSSPRAHTETSFDLVVRAPYAETAPLFGPEGERVWAGKHWNPQWIYPQPGRDEQGGVFTIQHGPLQAVWAIARHDLDARQFQYVYTLGNLMLCTIDVRFTVLDSRSTGVHVTYTRTAISPEGDEHVAAMTEGDRRAGAEWQAAIDNYLATLKKH